MDDLLIFASDDYIRSAYLSYMERLGGAWAIDVDREVTYNILFTKLHTIKFEIQLERDANRIADVDILRHQFEDESNFALYDCIYSEPPSFLEVCLVLAIRMNRMMAESEDKDETSKWLWIMFNNCGFERFTDDSWNFNNSEQEVNEIAYRVMNRTYEPNGEGNIFVLNSDIPDQRTVEIWYQMQSFLNENF